MKVFDNIYTRNQLADHLKISVRQLNYLLYCKRIDNCYISFEIPKKSGGVRSIDAPIVELKVIQRALVNALYEHINKKRMTKSKVAHAFEKEKSIITNAKIHRNKRIVLNIDLENFFESIHFGRVRGFFNKNKNFLLPLDIATIIAQIACYRGKLPQGAPTSPIISNLICETLDHRLIKLAKKYRLDYTRYADDLTFSTNDKKFFDSLEQFYQEISSELKRAGFHINEKKTRLQLRDSKQIVTGLIVNKKINVDRNYYKKTRAMAHQLYTHGSYTINGKPATINQLEGRFAFIDQLTKYNNKKDGENHCFYQLSSRERQYQKFLFYKYFFANPKPLIVTEGKTDIVYIKSALKKLYKDYPELISKNDDDTFEFKVSFLNKTKRLRYFLDIVQDGASAFKNIYRLFDNKKFELLSYFKKKNNSPPKNPVIFLFDNEIRSGKKKPIGDFLNHIQLDVKKRSILDKEYAINLIDNLYILTVPLINGKSECEIEDLFDEETLNHQIDGRSFSRQDDYDKTKHYGKEYFSKYISQNYSQINFNEFRTVLDKLNNIINDYQKAIFNAEHDSNIKTAEKDSSDKIA